jgi:magnesium chelatase family protein
MNYFSVKSALISGVQALPVHVECVQSRRLPFLQILGISAGAAAELRERVLAALESSRCKLPARRFTVQIRPAGVNLPGKSLDLAVALALLGSSGLVPAGRMGRLLVCGALGLDGSLQESGGMAPLRMLLEGGEFDSALLPWSESGLLSEQQMERGGGFRTLSDLVNFLRDAKARGSRNPAAPELSAASSQQVWKGARLPELAGRALEISAAGMHHLLIEGPRRSDGMELASALASFLPALSAKEAEEIRNIYALAGIAPPAARPMHSFGKSSALPSLTFDRRFSRVEEALLAHRGVLFLDSVDGMNKSVFPLLCQPMQEGCAVILAAGQRSRLPFEPLVLASMASCSCGARGDPGRVCCCRPTEAARRSSKREQLLRQNFDLYLFLRPDLRKESGQSPGARRERIEKARQTMLVRQGKWNSRLSGADLLAVKPWEENALALWRKLGERDLLPGPEATARVALTISDLSGAEVVQERFLLEALHFGLFQE